MDSSQYKDRITSRGFNYHYFFSSATGDKPTLLFLHGFPSTSLDWSKQVTFFIKEGYGVLVPDLLGYGGTDKPNDPSSYKKAGMVEDIVSLLDAEKIDKIFGISHDWGSGLNSALAHYQSARFRGFAFLAVGYLPPAPTFEIEGFLAMQKSMVGYEPYGYWLFLCEDGADKILEENIDSFLSIIYPHDAKIWLTDMAPRGALKSWLMEGKKAGRPDYLTDKELQNIKSTLLQGGFAGPLCWYKATVDGHNNKDDEAIPQDKYVLQAPAFLAAPLQDYACLPSVARFVMEKTCPHLEVKEYNTGHWVQLAASEQLNSDLLEWIKQYE